MVPREAPVTKIDAHAGLDKLILDMLNARQFTREITKTVWPALRDVGFSKFAPRDAWRRSPHATECLNFFCYGAQARKYRATGLSFNLSVGIYYPQAHEDRLEFPKEPECDVRVAIPKRLRQDGFDNPRIWYVDEDGSNLLEVMSAAKDSILAAESTLSSVFADPGRALDAFLDDDPKLWKRLGTDDVLFPDWTVQAALALGVGKLRIAQRILDGAREMTDNWERQAGQTDEEARRKIAAMEKRIRRRS